MGGRPITFFFFVTFIMGSIAGFLGATQFHKTPNASKALKTISELSDQDYLSTYHDYQGDLLPDELTLGDRLFACLDSKPKKTQNKWRKDEAELPQAAHIKAFVDEAPIQKNFPEGNLSYYEMPGQKVAPLQIAGGKLLALFPSKAFAVKNAENVGIESGQLSDVKSYLDQHLCNDPSFSVMTEEQKNRIKFFDVVKDDSFKGNTIVSLAGGKQTLNTAMLFNSPTHGGYDYLETADKKKKVVEKRMISAEGTNEAWRFNSCQPSVALLSDRCPWNDRFAHEFKDFFISPDSKKLIGNIYCKNPTDAKWTNLGSFELDQTTEDAE